MDDKIKYGEFKLLVESESLESVLVTRYGKDQVWRISVSTKGKRYRLSLDKENRCRQFSNLENACRCLVKAGCYSFNVDATDYTTARSLVS